MLKTIIGYINNYYGSKRGLLNSAKYWLHYHLGQYRNLRNIQWSKVQRLVFVCSGNICRSPLAEACAKKNGFEAESFGLTCGDGYPADPRAIEFGLSQGLDMSGHRSRNIAQYCPRVGDLVVGMEPAHAELLEQYCGSEDSQLTVAGVWLDTPKLYIHDPFTGNAEFFSRCEDQVVKAAANIGKRIGRS